MIDGFIMRDASSYEDIVEVLREEGVFDDSLGADLHELVNCEIVGAEVLCT